MTNPFFDEERCLADTDPAKLVPRTIDLVPDDPEVIKLPKQYVGTEAAVYGESPV